LLVARLDRFARTLLGGLQTLEEIRQAGGVVLSAEGDFDSSTNTGELVLNMMLTLAQFELRRIRESWEVARERAVERGVHISGAPAGYRKRADGTLEPNEYAQAITQAFELRANGASQSEIGRHLLQAGVPTVRSGRAAFSWGQGSVQGLLENRVYLGEARSGTYIKEHAHSPLVTRAVFRAVQARMGTAKAASKKGGEDRCSGGSCRASCGGPPDTTGTRRSPSTAARVPRSARRE
jgi:site-specific DNA recombinase